MISTLQGVLQRWDEEGDTHARLGLWNSIFPDYKVNIAKASVASVLTSILKKYVREKETHMFCFEMAVLFIDLPDEFGHIVNCFPWQMRVAMKKAYDVVYESIEQPDPDNIREFILQLSTHVTEEKVKEIAEIIQNATKPEARLDQVAVMFQKSMPETLLDLFLSCLPGCVRLRLALLLNRPLPKIYIDFDRVAMPFEFVQALCDIDGIEQIESLIGD